MTLNGKRDWSVKSIKASTSLATEILVHLQDELANSARNSVVTLTAGPKNHTNNTEYRVCLILTLLYAIGLTTANQRSTVKARQVYIEIYPRLNGTQADQIVRQ